LGRWTECRKSLPESWLKAKRPTAGIWASGVNWIGGKIRYFTEKLPDKDSNLGLSG
jgi:hypothetical protein